MPAATQSPKKAPVERIIRDKEFGIRLGRACDGNPLIPEYNKGRLTWVAAALAERFGIKVSIETVRKWFAGEVKPRPRALSQLAQLLEVDEAWLLLGIEPDLQPREQKVRNAAAEGVVNVLAGLIQIGGGHPAFPAADDKRAQTGHIHLYAIIKGAQYAFHVALAKQDDDVYRFTLPAELGQAIVIGGVPTDGPGVEFYELTPDWIAANSSRKGSGLEAVMKKGDAEPRRIKNFGERL